MGLVLNVEHSDGRRAMRLALSEGDAGTRETLCAMRAVVHDAMRHPLIQTASPAIDNTPAGVWQWAQTSVKFKADPRGVEWLQHPARMLGAIYDHGHALGDCDDRTMLLCSIIARNPVRRVAIVAMGRPGAGRFEHVLPAIVRKQRRREATAEGASMLHVEDFYPLDTQEAAGLGQWPGVVDRFMYELV